jgi:hypothetical protein
MQNSELDINNVDDETFKNDEEFFRLMAGSLKRLGKWSLELHYNAPLMLGETNTQLIE